MADGGVGPTGDAGGRLTRQVAQILVFPEVTGYSAVAEAVRSGMAGRALGLKPPGMVERLQEFRRIVSTVRPVGW